MYTVLSVQYKFDTLYQYIQNRAKRWIIYITIYLKSEL
jgi:hypothetical protein